MKIWYEKYFQNIKWNWLPLIWSTSLHLILYSTKWILKRFKIRFQINLRYSFFLTTLKAIHIHVILSKESVNESWHFVSFVSVSFYNLTEWWEGWRWAGDDSPGGLLLCYLLHCLTDFWCFSDSPSFSQKTFCNMQCLSTNFHIFTFKHTFSSEFCLLVIQCAQ